MILETKIQLPQPKSGTVIRRSFLELVENNLDKRLILITADAGYGKTTLLGQLIKEARLPCLFYDLDKSDSDLLVFYSYLVNGIKQIDPALVKYSQKLLKQGSETGKNFELLFGTLINELFEKRKEELFVILDNYHNLAEDSLVHRAFDFFIDRLPENIHVIISSRSAPHLPSLARWRAKQDMFEVSRKELAFTGEDIAALLKDVYKTALTEEDLRQVAAHTEGWITGIRLILQSNGRGEKTIQQSIHEQMEANQPLFEYFANEVLSRESSEMQRFLTRSSILDIVTPAACDAILGVKDSEQVLKNLEKRHLFITAAGEGEYKYHHLFREFLQRRLNDEGTALHRKAAAYYKRQGNTEQAIEHYLEAKDYDKAGVLICKIADEMAMKARFNALDNWFQLMPEDAIIKQPELLAHISSLRTAQGRLDEAGAKYGQVLLLLKKKGDVKALAMTLLEQGRLLWMQGNNSQAHKILRQALRTQPGKNAKKFDECLEGKILNLTALVLMALGNLNKAKVYLSRAKQLKRYIQNSSNFNVVESNLAQICSHQGEERTAYYRYHALIPQIGEKYYFRVGCTFFNAAFSAITHGKIEWAEQVLEQGWSLCRPYDDAWSKSCLHYGYGHLYLQKARWDLALHHLNEAVDGATHLGLSKLICAALRDICRVHRCQSDYAGAQVSLDQALSASGGKAGQLLLGLKVEQSLLQSCRGEFENAERTIQNCTTQAKRAGWIKAMFLSQLAGAIIYAGQGKEKRAISRLRHAVRLSKLKGYDGILMRELRASPKLTGLAQKRKVEPEYLGRILTECKAYDVETAELSLTARLLGGFELAAGDDDRKIQLTRKATKAILAFFLLHPGRGFTWEEIAAWAWPDSAAKVSHQMLKNTMWEIHHIIPALKTAIEYKDNHYTLRSNPLIRVDALEFSDAIAKAAAVADASEKINLLGKAVALYHGQLLSGVYYNWADDLRNAYEEKYTLALAALAKAFFTNGEYEKSAECCLTCIKTDELDEDIHRLLLADYIKLGLKTKALKHYANLKKLLRKQLHTEPSAETVALIQSIL